MQLHKRYRQIAAVIIVTAVNNSSLTSGTSAADSEMKSTLDRIDELQETLDLIDPEGDAEFIFGKRIAKMKKKIRQRRREKYSPVAIEDVVSDGEDEKTTELKGSEEFELVAPILHPKFWLKMTELVPLGLLGINSLNDNTILYPNNKEMIRLDGLLGQSSTSAVYAIQGHPEYVIKYNLFCGGEEEIDSLENENKILDRIHRKGKKRFIESTDLTNSMLYLSAPADDVDASMLLENNNKGKVKLFECDKVYKNSIRKYPAVRFAIFSKVGIDLFKFIKLFDNKKYPSGLESHTEPDGTIIHYAKPQVPFVRAMILGLEMLTLTENLHSLKIVNDDLHSGNFVFKIVKTNVDDYQLDPHDNKLLIIDFGRSFILSNEELAARPNEDEPIDWDSIDLSKLWCHGVLSLWQSLRKPSSFRDDLYRVLLVLATMIYGPIHSEFLQYLCKINTKDMLEMYLLLKYEANFFHFEAPVEDNVKLPGVQQVFNFNLHMVLPKRFRKSAGSVDAVSELFGQMITLVRATPPNSKPPYQAVRNLMETVLQMVQAAT